MRDKPVVALAKCQDYDNKRVEKSLREAVDNLGGIAEFVKPGQRVLLKVNLLMKKKPDDAVTTHPAVVEAVVNMVKAAGGIPVIGDSPAGPFNERSLKGIYAASGLQEVAERTGAELNWDFGETTLAFPNGKVAKSLTIAKFVADADVVIPLSKLKTHSLTVMTGAVKILFGVIPGLIKAEYHLKMSEVEDFADLLVDIALAVKPQLNIMDAVIGMEGNGPSAGTPRPIGAILASRENTALDVVAARLIGFRPEDIPTIMAARKRGLVSRPEEFTLVGPALEQLIVRDYKAPSGSGLSSIGKRMPKPVRDVLLNRLRPKPDFVHGKCIGCADCVRSCPPEALTLNEQKRPVVDLDKCIRCFCCQELCPKQAVEIRRPWLGQRIWGK